MNANASPISAKVQPRKTDQTYLRQSNKAGSPARVGTSPKRLVSKTAKSPINLAKQARTDRQPYAAVNPTSARP